MIRHSCLHSMQDWYIQNGEVGCNECDEKPMINEFPTPAEIRRWLTDTLRHAAHIEYYLERLQIGRSDIQRPHDLIGLGNKFEWAAIRGFAMQYRPDSFELYVRPALEFHRQQYHHFAWNEFNPTASPDAMRLGAVDAVCSLLEPRGYQGGCHTWDQIAGISENNPIHKVAWMHLVAKDMQKIDRPDLTIMTIESPRRIIGLSAEKHEIMVERLYETLNHLKHEQGIDLTVI